MLIGPGISPVHRRRIVPSTFDYGSYSGYALDVDTSVDVYESTDTSDPAEVGDAVANLVDQASGMQFNSQGTSERPILRETAGGIRYLEFDGVDDHFLDAWTAGTFTAMTLFMVTRHEGPDALGSTYTDLVSGLDSGGDSWNSASGFAFGRRNEFAPRYYRMVSDSTAAETSYTSDAPHVITAGIKGDGTLFVRTNDNAEATAALGSSPTIDLADLSFLGGGGTKIVRADLDRVLIYTSYLSDTEQQEIRNQLYSDYGITP